jgi:hypothetical protein
VEQAKALELNGWTYPRHLAHRVELKGRLTDDPPSASGNSTTAKTTVDASGRATTRVETRMDIAGVRHATPIKMVSASCH